MDENIAQFTAITSADPAQASQYLQLTENNLEQAIALFFEGSNDFDLGGSNRAQTSSTLPAASTTTSQARPSGGNDEDIIQIDSDDDMDFDDSPTTTTQRHPAASTENDEAMARRLQEEMYGGAGGAGDLDPEDVRAPMARTTETLVGGPGGWDDPDDINAAVAEQMLARQRRLAQHGRPGIFNQRLPQSSVWDQDESSSGASRRDLSRATGGASEASAKSNMLAEMYRPPFEIMTRVPWDQARDQGKSEEKWILVNVQDSAIFDCQVLNRDIWKDAQIKDTIKENFLFIQYLKDDPQGAQYVNYYFHARDSPDAYPHIAIVDPRTGEQVKVWSGPPIPKAMDFLMQLHEFLDRYSLNTDVRNPVANRKPEAKKVDVNRMTEEEMLELAMQNSLGNGGAAGLRDDDPDALTKQTDVVGKGKQKAEEPEAAPVSAFSHIPDDKPHTEPANDPATTTRIQFRHSGGRQIHRFGLAEPVQRIFEWLKASPLEGKEDVEFELIAMGKNLIELLDTSIGDAGLKNGTVMVEFLDS